MAADQLDKLDYYTLLGVESDATTDEIKRAFRKFALRYHPDRHVESGPDAVTRATTIYRRGSEALETLTHLTQRGAYDAGLTQGELRLTSDARVASPSRTGVKASRTSTKRSVPAGDAKKRPATASYSTRKSAAPPARTAPREMRSPSAKAFYARALESSRAGDYRTALRMVDNALEQEPDHPTLIAARDRLLPYTE